jgi:hypothetical protein
MDHVNSSNFQIMDHVGMLCHFYSVYRPLHSMWSTPTALLATTEGQTGVAHPQAPGVKDARMFKVLSEISEEVRSGQRGESSLGISGRIRSPEMKSLLAKQLGMGLASLEGAGQLDLKTGRLTSKKQKKEKTRSNWLWMSLKSCLTSSLYQDYTMSEMFSFGIFINFTFSPLLCPAEVEESCQ